MDSEAGDRERAERTTRESDTSARFATEPSQPGAPDHAAWLARLCKSEGARGGLLFLGPEGGPFAPVAVWPHVFGGIETLAESAQRALREDAALVLEPPALRGQQRLHITRPLHLDGAVRAAVALELAGADENQARACLDRLQIALGGVEASLLRNSRNEISDRAARFEAALQLTSVAIDATRFREAATAVVSQLATTLELQRASLGFERHGRIELMALSHSARIERKANLVRSLEAAMEEAFDQRVPIGVPAESESPRILRCHEQLALEREATIYSVPVLAQGRLCGVLCVERSREQPFDESERALVEAAAALVGPVLQARRESEQGLITHGRTRARAWLERGLGPEGAGLKAVALLVLVLVLFVCLYRTDYRVTGEALLEPLERRAAVAPFEGYLAEAPVRAGDRVAEGDLVARLDDRDLSLERARIASQLGQLGKQLREARAGRDTAQAQILAAGIDEATARLQLVEDRLDRAHVLAPYDGIVVSGDLSQALGSPFSRGDVLFEIAPLDEYRLILYVDEHDIRDVSPGQRGGLVLSAAPDLKIDFDVLQVTPLSEATEQGNRFRTEARMIDPPELLRPGMEGIGKVRVAERPLIWIWTHDALNWLKLALWSWTP